MTSVPHSGAKSVSPGGSVAGGHTAWEAGQHPAISNGWIVKPVLFGANVRVLPDSEGGHVVIRDEKVARLIAAAPELLAALQGAIGALEFSQDYHRDLGNEDQAFAADRLDAARAAIAKATAGETRDAEPIHRRDGDEG